MKVSGNKYGHAAVQRDFIASRYPVVSIARNGPGGGDGFASGESRR